MVRRVQLLAATALAVVSLIPWLLFAKDFWVTGIQAAVPSSGISPRSILLIGKELFGLGYLGSGIIFCLCVSALWSASVTRQLKLILLASILLPITGVLIADSLTGYFLAIRQMIFVLPSVALLTALGVEALIPTRWAKLGWGLLAALLVLQLVGIASWLGRPREEWQAAAQLLRNNRSRYECIVFVPDEISKLYRIFDPQLAEWSCSSTALKQAYVVAVSLSGPVDTKNPTGNYYRMKALGLRQSVRLGSGEPKVILFSR